MRILSNIKISSVNTEDFVWDSAKEDQVALRWLGQAGFQIFYKNYHLMIDPYLSNHLAKKYVGTEFSHARMMPSPVAASEINDLDFILCTHRHSDHMDPETVPVLLENNLKCQIVAPRAEKKYVTRNLGIDEDRAIFINAGGTITLNDYIQIEVVPSAHEELKKDQNGNHYYLGYILRLDDIVLYHSGDCIPYASLPYELKNREIDIALLPVNGRDEYRRSRGILGNFTLSEAFHLCRKSGISFLIGHHFGMFDFNTINVNEVKKQIEEQKETINCRLAEVGINYVIEK